MAEKFTPARRTDPLPAPRQNSCCTNHPSSAPAPAPGSGGRGAGFNDPRIIGSTTASGRGVGFNDPRLIGSTASTASGRGVGFIDPRIVKPGAYGQPSTENPQEPNSYPHESDNVVTSPDPTAPLKLNTAFQPNLLDNYDVVTYHWKFFITTPEASTTGKIFDTANQIIIAESGVTDLTIDNVQIESITTPTVDSGTGLSTHVKFEITEPAGAGLIDKIFYESLALGIGNWNVMPFYLQLQFKGRDPESSEADSGEPGAIGNLRWVWALKLSDMKANVTLAGTKYEISGIIYNELAQSNVNFTMQHTLVLENLSKLGDAMTQLEKHLNDDQIYRLIDSASIPDTYRIILDPAIEMYTITPVNHNADSQRNDSTAEWNGKNATFSSGTAVDKIIDTLCSQTEEFQILIKNSGTPGENGKPITEEVSQMKKMWRIITETRPLGFDPRQNNYAKEYTIFIIQYDIGILDSDTSQDTSGDKSIQAERKRLETYVKKAILKKKYNYIFTGLNDQVINFDIRINNAFAFAQARMGGIYYNTAMTDIGMVNHTHTTDEGSVTEKLQNAIRFQHSKDAGSVKSREAYKAAQEAINTGNLPPETRERYTKLLQNSKPESWTNYAKSVQAAGGINQNGDLITSRRRSKSIATPIEAKGNESTLAFISDVNSKGIDAEKAYNDFVKGVSGRLRPVARVDTMQQRQIGAGIESSSNSGIQKLSSVFSVAMHSSQDVSFAKIKLNIKGDPFWLFPQPTTDNDARLFNSLKPKDEAIAWVKRAHFQTKDSVNIAGTDNFLIIRFRTPKVYDVQAPDDSAELQDIETFSGVFKAISISNKFESGRFTQELDCLMDYNINILNFMEEIETASATEDVKTNPEDLIPKTDLVKNFSVSERLKVPGAEKIKELKAKGAELASNVPKPQPNIIAGLPHTFTRDN